MDVPKMFETRPVADDTELLPAYMPVPGLGILPVNAYLIRGREPVLVDASLGALRGPFIRQLRASIDLEDLRWIWVTHTDPDHVGALPQLLLEAPKARVVTTYLGMGKLNLLGIQVPPERVFLLNPGQRLDIGDRELVGLRPPTYDAPETTALYDTRSAALFSSDCFGALMDEPQESAREMRRSDLERGVQTWTTVDAPWLGSIDDRSHAASLEVIRRFDPATILSSHLPPAYRMTDELVRILGEARRAEPFVGPDQAALEAMLSAA